MLYHRARDNCSRVESKHGCSRGRVWLALRRSWSREVQSGLVCLDTSPRCILSRALSHKHSRSLLGAVLRARPARCLQRYTTLEAINASRSRPRTVCGRPAVGLPALCARSLHVANAGMLLTGPQWPPALPAMYKSCWRRFRATCLFTGAVICASGTRTLSLARLHRMGRRMAEEGSRHGRREPRFLN